MTRVALDVLPTPGHDVAVLSALAGRGCVVEALDEQSLRVTFQVPVRDVGRTLEDVLAHVAAVVERAHLRSLACA